MKTRSLSPIPWVAAFWLTSNAVGFAAADELAFKVPFELGRAQFAPGDHITIQSVTGTADTFNTNETYCVEGTYTLSSHDEANLCLFVTTRQDIRTPVDPRQSLRVQKGSGSFRLLETMTAEGYPHVSFYPTSFGGDFGGIYFGHGDWLLAQNGFGHSEPGEPPASQAAEAPARLVGANRALLAYLGNPVDAPAALDPAYTPAGLREAVQSAAAQAGVALRKIAIEESEFPYLIGVICERDDFAKLRSSLEALKTYEFHGTVSGHGCVIFHLTPRRVWPSDATQRIDRRSSVRMERFYYQLETRE